MKNVRICLLTGLLTALLASFAVSAAMQSALSQPLSTTTSVRVLEENGWKKIETDAITVLFPCDGRKPMFMWWYTGEPETIYVVKYQGLVEYFTFVRPFYTSRYRAHAEKFHELVIKPKMAGPKKIGPKEIRDIMNVTKTFLKKWHPPYLPFSACKWNLTDIENVTTEDGELVCLSFSFKLMEVPMPWFRFAEGNIELRCRFYNVPVEEKVGKDTGSVLYSYNVSAGEMKMDFIVKNWEWNLDAFEPLVPKFRPFKIVLPMHQSGLALWINLASFNATELEIAEKEPELIERMATTSHILMGNRRVFVKPNNTSTDEKQIILPKEHHKLFKLQFAKEDETLAGFFRFIASAKVTNGTDTYVKPVTASYIEAGAHMRLFIGYPYFGNGTLEHDPSFGVEVPATTAPEATIPRHVVEAPTGEQITPKVVREIVPPFITQEMIMILVVVASIIAVMVLAARWRSKVINIVR